MNGIKAFYSHTYFMIYLLLINAMKKLLYFLLPILISSCSIEPVAGAKVSIDITPPRKDTIPPPPPPIPLDQR